MADFRFVTEVMAPPHLVWETLVDVGRWPAWTPTVTSAEHLNPGPLTVGSKVSLIQPRLMPAVWQVTTLDERERLFVWSTAKPGIRITGTHRVERTELGSRVTIALDYSGLLGPLMAFQLKDLNWQYLTAEAQGLKAYCEARALEAI